MIKAVIFDLDDTLISERQYIESGYRHISNLLCTTFNQDQKHIYKMLIKLFNQSHKNVFNRLFEQLGVSYTSETIMELVDEYRNHFPRIEFFADVLPCLESLEQINIKTGIITDGYANAQRQKLKAVGAYDIFNEIIITDDLGREYWKPHPKAFEIIKEKLEVEFSEIIYIGDNPEKDFYIAKFYPVKTARIYRKGFYNDSCYFENIRETYKLSSLLDIIEIIY